MFGSPIIDLAIGLVFTFLAVSLAASAITETIASAVKWRSKTLKKGIMDLLNDQSFSDLALQIYNHALVNPRADGTATGPLNPPPNRKLPAYIERIHFAHALIDIAGIASKTLNPATLKQIANRVQDAGLKGLLEDIVDYTASTAADAQALKEKIRKAVPPATHGDLPAILTSIVDRITQPQQDDPAPLKERIAKLSDAGLRQTLTAILYRTANIVGVLTDPNAIKARVDALVSNDQLKMLLDGIVDRTVGDTQKISDEIALWFDSAMDRVSGAYKRWSQLVSFIAALILVIILNISAIHVTQRLWAEPIATKMIGQITAIDYNSNQDAKKLIQSLEILSPGIGWPDWNEFANFWTSKLWTFDYDAWERVLGWIITALATLFGAAFWFDTLQQIVRLKGAGASPLEKVQGKGAAS